MTEDPATSYYDGQEGASTLPKNITITNGVGNISIDSVSNIIMPPVNISDVPKPAKLNLTDISTLSIDSNMDYEVEQWVKDSDLEVSFNPIEINDPNMPDWLEKASWDKINKYKSQGGLIGHIVGLVKGIHMYYISPLDPNPPSTIGGTCGVTPFLLNGNIQNAPNYDSGGNIFISPFCATIGHRRNISKTLDNTIIHESRHLYQYTIMLNNYIGVTDNGINNPILNDSDLDICPEIVPPAIEAALLDDPNSPIQEGASITVNGNVIRSTNDGQPELDQCLQLGELDAEQYGNDHAN